MRKIDKFGHAAKGRRPVPPASGDVADRARTALSRKKGGAAVVTGKKPAPTLSAARRSGTG